MFFFFNNDASLPCRVCFFTSLKHIQKPSIYLVKSFFQFSNFHRTSKEKLFIPFSSMSAGFLGTKEDRPGRKDFYWIILEKL